MHSRLVTVGDTGSIHSRLVTVGDTGSIHYTGSIHSRLVTVGDSGLKFRLYTSCRLGWSVVIKLMVCGSPSDESFPASDLIYIHVQCHTYVPHSVICRM